MEVMNWTINMVMNFRRLAIFLLFLLFAFVAFPFVLALRAQLCLLLIFSVPVPACHAFNFFIDLFLLLAARTCPRCFFFPLRRCSHFSHDELALKRCDFFFL